jgi:hypothetical protein
VFSLFNSASVPIPNAIDLSMPEYMISWHHLPHFDGSFWIIDKQCTQLRLFKKNGKYSRIGTSGSSGKIGNADLIGTCGGFLSHGGTLSYHPYFILGFSMLGV